MANLKRPFNFQIDMYCRAQNLLERVRGEFSIKLEQTRGKYLQKDCRSATVINVVGKTCYVLLDLILTQIARIKIKSLTIHGSF